MKQNLGEIYFSGIPSSRVGEYTGRIKCPCHYEFWRHIESIFRNVKDKIVVDMGCGPGLKSLTLALSGARVVAIDCNEEKLNDCKRNSFLVENLHGRLNVFSYRHDLRKKIPFLNSDFADFILCYEVIEHLDETKTFISEILRIMKCGSLAIVTTPNKNVCFPADREKLYGEELYGHTKVFNADTLKAVFDIKGVKVEKIFFYKHFLMRLFCGIIHKFMKFDKYKRPLPTLFCRGYNLILFPVLNFFVHLEEKLKEKRDSGKHIFIVIRKEYKP
ncbi:MAG: class I SAM-dependent methyltransferase [Candidatus Omnitrophota bacterium]|nr:class I SAM-dependent methyltransferase [Candidatus Omnitrophota bacterium]